MERYSDPCISTKGEGLKKGAWSDQEDKLLSSYIIANGEGKWTHVAKSTGLNRSGKSCRLRWLNYLKPDIKRGNITRDEEDLIIRLHKLLGNKWSLIAGRIPGRTDNEIKNYWNTTLSKKLRTQACTVKTERNPSNVVIQTKPWKCKNVVIQHPPCPKENLLHANHIEFQEADPTTTHFTNKCQNSSPPLPESRVVDVHGHHQFNRNENFDGNLLYLGNNDNALYTDLSNGQCHQTIDHVMFNDWSTSCLELDKYSIASWDMDSLAFLMESEVWDVSPLI